MFFTSLPFGHSILFSINVPISLLILDTRSLNTVWWQSNDSFLSLEINQEFSGTLLLRYEDSQAGKSFWEKWMYHHCKVKHILRWYFFDVVADWVINVYDKDAVRRILSSHKQQATKVVHIKVIFFWGKEKYVFQYWRSGLRCYKMPASYIVLLSPSFIWQVGAACVKRR